MNKWSNSNDDKTWTVQHLNKITPGNNGNDLQGKILKQLITVTGGTKEVVKKYILVCSVLWSMPTICENKTIRPLFDIKLIINESFKYMDL